MTMAQAENCIPLHRANGKGSSKVTRFFKVMFGKGHDKFMELPHAFAENMARQLFHLKDAIGGRQWPVLLSRVEGCLSFTTGWSIFYHAHGLEEGSFLVFEHVEGSKSFSFRVFETTGLESACKADPKITDKSSPENEADDPIRTRFDPSSAEREVDTEVGSVDEVIELEEDDGLGGKTAEDALEKDSAFEGDGSGARMGKRKGDASLKDTNDRPKAKHQKASGSKIPNFFPEVTVRKDWRQPAKTVVKTEKFPGFNAVDPRFGAEAKSKPDGRETKSYRCHRSFVEEERIRRALTR